MASTSDLTQVPLTMGPSATGPDNLEEPVPQQPVEGTPQRQEALISQSRPCETKGWKETPC